MHLIAPDVLAEARGLSPFLSAIGLVIGGLIWLFGWHWHRFWVVAAVTLTGGLIGLQAGKSSGGHILAMGVLLAFSAGVLALELARIFAFIAAGTAVWLAANVLFPKGQELWVGLLIGGLLGVFLYRFWTMLLTSFVGVVLGVHSLLCLVESLFRLDAQACATANSLILNGAVLAASCLGVVAQSLYERWHVRRTKRRKKQEEEEAIEKIRAKEREKFIPSAPTPSELSAPPSIWDRLLGKKAA